MIRPLAEQRRIVAKVDELNADFSPALLSLANAVEHTYGLPVLHCSVGVLVSRWKTAAGCVNISEPMAVLDALEATSPPLRLCTNRRSGCALSAARTTAEKLLAATIAKLHAA